MRLPRTYFMLSLIVLLFAVVPEALSAKEDAQTPDPKTLALLTEFSAALQAKMKDVHGDDQIEAGAAEIENFSKRIADEQLPSVEQFALSKDGAATRWAFVRLLVERARFDLASHVIVEDLVPKPNRPYVLWKWWEYNFGRVKAHEEYTRLLSLALLHQFETGSAEYKMVVAELLGKGEAEAKMSNEDFKKAVNFETWSKK